MDLPTAVAYLAEFKKREAQATVIPICAELEEGIPEVKKYLKHIAAKIKNA